MEAYHSLILQTFADSRYNLFPALFSFVHRRSEAEAARTRGAGAGRHSGRSGTTRLPSAAAARCRPLRHGGRAGTQR